MTKNKQTALGVALSAALAAAGGSDVALAANHHGKNARKRKASKKTILVRCASVTVRCVGTPGARGKQGPTGPNGGRGPDGRRGVPVIARARSMHPLVTATSGAFDPLSANHWVQGPADDERILAAVTYTAPATCNSGSGPNVNVAVGVETFLDGNVIGYASLVGKPGQTQTDALSLAFSGNGFGTRDGDLMADGVAHDHVLTTRVTDNCGTAPTGHYIVQSVAYDVVSFS
jgi:hypothetical protein